MHVTSKVRDYATLIVCKNSLIDFSSVKTLIVNEYNDIILCKFKVVKFTL